MAQDPVHVHARAEQCSLPTVVHGRRVMTYQGEEYVMLGLYFARSLNGQRELYYILRPLDGAGRSE